PGSGTAPVTGATIPGVVPHVTCGEIAEASTSISRSNSAPSSVRSARHSSTGSRSGAAGRPSSHSRVTSSGATIPARPPPSIVMLQIVIRPSIESRSTGSPAYSIAWPTPPEMPAVALGRLDLDSRQVIRDLGSDLRAVGGHVVVGRRERAVGPAHPAPGHPEAVESLRRGDLVDHVQVDVDEARPDLVRTPD